MLATSMKRILPLLIIMGLTSCTTMQDFTTCTLIAGLANQRSYTFDGRVNGERVKDTVNWTAGASDPHFMDPFECTQMLARRRELLANLVTPVTSARLVDRTVDAQPSK